MSRLIFTWVAHLESITSETQQDCYFKIIHLSIQKEKKSKPCLAQKRSPPWKCFRSYNIWGIHVKHQSRQREKQSLLFICKVKERKIERERQEKKVQYLANSKIQECHFIDNKFTLKKKRYVQQQIILTPK